MDDRDKSDELPGEDSLDFESGFDFGSNDEDAEAANEGLSEAGNQDGSDDALTIDDWMSGFSEEAPDYSLDELSQAYAQILADSDQEPAEDDGQQPGDESDQSEPDSDSSPENEDQGREDGNHSSDSDPGQQQVQQEAIAFLKPVVTVDRNDDLQQDDRVTLTPERIVESILFVGTPDNSPVSGRLIASLIRGVSPKEVQQYVSKLNDIYRTDGCPYRIEQEPLGYRMVLREAFQAIRSRFYGQVREVKLSQVVIDTLAVVAFHQPVTREQVESFMGRPSGANLNQLLRRNLLNLEVVSKTEKLYRTTDRFLDLFGIESLDDLPQVESEEE